MNSLKKSFFPFALSSIMLFASVSPVECAKRVPKPVVAPVLIESIPVKSKKRHLSFKQKLRKKFKKIKNGISEFVEEHPVASVASVVSAIALWFFWDKIFTPWVHRENVVGPSACDIQEVVVPQGAVRQLEIRFANRVQAVRLAVNNPVRIIQIRSAVQGPGGACGYHAIKNCMQILNELGNPRGDLQLQLTDNDLCERLFGLQGQRGVWRQLIIGIHDLRVRIDREQNEQAREALINARPEIALFNVEDFGANGDWLGQAAVIEIINQQRQLARAGNPRLLDNPDIGITVTSPREIPIQNNFDAARNDLANNRPHGFIITTDRGNGDRNAHWITAVANRGADGNIRWYLANSQNNSILDLPVLRDLIAAVEGVQVPNAPQ